MRLVGPPAGFIAWSILTALATLIWFFPLFNMSLSGEEAAVVTTLVPIVLGFKAVRGLVLRSQVRPRPPRPARLLRP